MPLFALQLAVASEEGHSAPSLPELRERLVGRGGGWRSAVDTPCGEGSLLVGRIRTIKPEFFTDETIAELPFQHRLAFIGLWTQADKAGRLEDRPKRLKAVLFPYDRVDLDKILSDLTSAKFIVRYSVNGTSYIQIRTFAKHQRPHHTEKESDLPDLITISGETTVSSPLSHGEMPDGREGNGEGKGKEGNGEGSGQSSPAISPEIVSLLSGTTHFKALSHPRLAAYWKTSEEAFFGPRSPVVLEAELRKADSWLAANPRRKPTEQGLPDFFRKWLDRAVEIERRKVQVNAGPQRLGNTRR